MIEMAESKEAAQAIYAAYGIMNYRRLGHDTYFNEELEVAEVRYKHALRRLKRAFPGEFCDWTEQSATAMYTVPDGPSGGVIGVYWEAYLAVTAPLLTPMACHFPLDATSDSQP